MHFLFYLLAIWIWERWYFGGSISVATPFKKSTFRRRTRHLLVLNPSNFDARVDLARDALERRRYEEARSLLEPALAKAGDVAEVPRLHGDALLGLGLFDKAALAYETALRIDPKDIESHLGAARAYFALGRNDDARREVETYRETRPGDSRGSWAEAAIRAKVGGVEGRNAAGDALRTLVAEQRLKPGYARRRDRKWAVKARLALLAGQPPAKAW